MADLYTLVYTMIYIGLRSYETLNVPAFRPTTKDYKRKMPTNSLPKSSSHGLYIYANSLYAKLHVLFFHFYAHIVT